MPDINFTLDTEVFNYRVGAVIKKNNKILVQKDGPSDYYTLIGGRCKLGESSVEAALREVKEETGINAKYVKTLGIIENFFLSSYNHKNYHEILIINEIKLESDIDDIKNIEGKDEKYEWLSLDELKESKFLPEIVLDIIKNNQLVHIINKDNVK